MVHDRPINREKILDNSENREKCHCNFCPSFPNQCGRERLYCSIGASSCDVPPNACICDTCPIYYEYSLKDLYYCVKEESGHSKTPIRKRYDDESEDSYQSMVDIKDLSQGYEILTSMGSPKEMPVKLDDLHFIPGQVNKIPLNTDDKVDIKTIIGPNAKKPFKINSPIIISGMSFGAVSRNVRLIISSAASLLKMGFNSGEGGVLDEELEFKDFMILQYSTGRFGISDQLLKSAAAIEIRFGQGAYPGKGSYLPADKITAEVARVRGLKVGEAANSPARHPDIANQNQLEKKIKWLKNKSSGAPVGAKIGCGNVEADVKLLADAGVDYIALDGFGAATGATNAYVRDNVGIPIIAALPRAFKTLKKMGKQDISLIASGGIRNSMDMARCLALGADAVYIGTAALIALNCEQYRICYTGLCPTGVTTQNQQLIKQLDLEEGKDKLGRFLLASNNELANICRLVGKNSIKDLDSNDLVSINRETSLLTGIKWLDGKNIKNAFGGI